MDKQLNVYCLSVLFHIFPVDAIMKPKCKFYRPYTARKVRFKQAVNLRTIFMA